MIKLNILLPTYNYPSGTNLILNKIFFVRKYINQTIIYDNSRNKSIYNLFKQFKPLLNIRYNYNKPTLFPQKNWENLIKNSNCDYFILLHYKEITIIKL